jgi:membrane protein DedA with SNARE-associated domain
MHAFDEFLLKYGYWVLFLNVLTEQIGLPVPSLPVFLAMGALAGLGNFSIWAAVAVAVVGAMASDLVWYRLGRSRGNSILSLMCRISLEPDSCVSNTKNIYRKLGAYALLFAKFVPGLNTAAAPLAGLTKMPLYRFAAFDFVGATVWSGAYLMVGYVFRNQLERVGDLITQTGARFLVVILVLLAAYVGWKYYQRRRFIQGLRVARITPDELAEMIKSGEEPAIVDLRHILEVEYEGWKLPGAIQMDLQEIEGRHQEIPRDRDVILYCS